MPQNWMISNVIRELGEEFNYSALVYLVNKKRLDPGLIKSEIQEAIKKGYIKRKLEVRCCECGADQGRYENRDSIPQRIVCDLCGSTMDKKDDYFFEEHVEAIYNLTEVGKRFFRNPFRRILSTLIRA